MTLLSQSNFASTWIDQFEPSDRKVARGLIDKIMLVTRDELSGGLVSLLDSIMAGRQDQARPIALYAEREVTRTDGEVDAFFPGSEAGRATGPGVSPVAADDLEVGSEGTIANLITGYARLHRGSILSHPGPDRMRWDRVGTIVVVADFIGSGKRVYEMLEAFARVATIQSWRSLGYIDFYVLAYSGTSNGIAHVQSSRLDPKIILVKGCPTVYNAFHGVERGQVISLCNNYSPQKRNHLGFRNGGALIAFAHGMPNNAPALLHVEKGNWKPLFRNRSTLGAGPAFPSDSIGQDLQHAVAMLRINISRSHLTNSDGNQWIKTLLVLAALKMAPSSAQKVSAVSHIPVRRVDEIIGFLLIAKWASRRGSVISLTDLGRRELQRLQRRRSRAPVLPTPTNPFYYPTQLRDR